MQHGVALFHFASKMSLQYEEPNPTSRQLAARMIERLARHLELWLDDMDVTISSAATALVAQHGNACSHRLAYAPGQRLCFVNCEYWREAEVLRPPTDKVGSHLLCLYVGTETSEHEVDLDTWPTRESNQ